MIVNLPAWTPTDYESVPKFRLDLTMHVEILQCYLERIQIQAVGIEQRVQRLATGWTVRRQNPGAEEIFRARSDFYRSLPGLLYNGYMSLG